MKINMAEIIRFEELDKADCPYCGNLDFHYMIEKNNRRKCKNCGKKFSFKARTYLSGSKLSMVYWFRLCYLIGDLKFPINSKILCIGLGITQKTCYKMLIRIKEALEYNCNGIRFKIPKNINSFIIMSELLKIKNNETT